MNSSFQDVVMAALLAIIILIIVFSALVLYSIDHIDNGTEGATIGGTTVPAVHCQEDEVISWFGPNQLGCIHYEEVN
jgi:hypothetical protein